MSVSPTAARPRNSVDHLEDKLWELRIRGRSGISRAIYVTASGQRVVITPGRELQLARQRAKDVT